MAAENNHPKVEIVKPVKIQRDTFTASSQAGSVVDCSAQPCSVFALSVMSNDGAATSWAVEAQGSDDPRALTAPSTAAWTTLKAHQKVDAGEGGIVFAADQPVLYFRAKPTELTLGGSTNISSVLKGMQ